MDLKTNAYLAAVYCEQANWLTHVEFRADKNSLDYADRLFIRRHHREMTKGHTLH
jgi:hypothetical protein